MGDVNQYTFVSRLAENLQGPFLEIGSKNYGSTQDFRPLLGGAGGQYVGVDMEDGPGVDKVLDLTDDFDVIDEALGGMRFGTIVCLSVLEHCAQPFQMAENMTRLLSPGGRVVISAPFAWKFHGYPSDYWRFTHEGIKKLFPRLSFDMDSSTASSSRRGEMEPLDEMIGRAPLTFRSHYQRGRLGRGIAAGLLRQLGKLPLFSWVVGYRYIMVPTNVFMVGTLEAASVRGAAA